jgi:ABC-type Fe3+/spermidine/putrescine transport system ATPase subunit
MTDFMHARATELSGGQAQRVSLARALAISPDCLLLDEPFSSLDALLREEMRAEVHDLILDMGVTTVLVTHDREEALEMGTSIAVMADGSLVEQGTPRELHRTPRWDFSADFLCGANLVEGDVVRLPDGGLEMRTGDGAFVAASDAGLDPDSEAISFALRPEDVRIGPMSDELPGSFNAQVTHVRFAGGNVVVELRIGELGGVQLKSRTRASELPDISIGDYYGVSWAPVDVTPVRRWRGGR